MPYYKDVNILLIHIPKTGGTSIEKFLKTQSTQTLYSGQGNSVIPDKEFQKYSLQHQYYSTLKKHHKLLDIDFSPKLKIITVVRNPYTRLISDLFFHKYINHRSTPSHVYNILPRYFNENKDNHASEQYKFLVDENNNEIPKNIIIMKTETLNQDMINNGFNNFSQRVNCGKHSRKFSVLNDFLNDDVINWVNTTYAEDFSFFNYRMKLPSEPCTTFIQDNLVDK